MPNEVLKPVHVVCPLLRRKEAAACVDEEPSMHRTTARLHRDAALLLFDGGDVDTTLKLGSRIRLQVCEAVRVEVARPQLFVGMLPKRPNHLAGLALHFDVVEGARDERGEAMGSRPEEAEGAIMGVRLSWLEK